MKSNERENGCTPGDRFLGLVLFFAVGLFVGMFIGNFDVKDGIKEGNYEDKGYFYKNPEPEFIVTKEVCEKIITFNEVTESFMKSCIILMNKTELECVRLLSNHTKQECHDEEVNEIRYWTGAYIQNDTYLSTYSSCKDDCFKIIDSDYGYANWSDEEWDRSRECYKSCDNNYLEEEYKTIKVEDLTENWIDENCECWIGQNGEAIPCFAEGDCPYISECRQYQCGNYKLRRKE